MYLWLLLKLFITCVLGPNRFAVRGSVRSVRSGRTTISLASEQVSDLYSVSFKRSDSVRALTYKRLLTVLIHFAHGGARDEMSQWELNKHIQRDSNGWRVCHRIDSWDHCFKFENSGMQPKYRDIWLIHYLCKCTVSSLNMHSHCSRSFRQGTTTRSCRLNDSGLFTIYFQGRQWIFFLRMQDGLISKSAWINTRNIRRGRFAFVDIGNGRGWGNPPPPPPPCPTKPTTFAQRN